MYIDVVGYKENFTYREEKVPNSNNNNVIIILVQYFVLQV